MNIRRFRPHVKTLATLLAIACFLSYDFAAVAPVLAAEPAKPPAQTGPAWETWPRRPVEPGTTAPTTGAEAAGEAAGAKTSEGISAGTWGWIAGGVAAVALIAVAAGGGGGGGDSSGGCNQ